MDGAQRVSDRGFQGRKYGHAGLVHSRRRLADDRDRSFVRPVARSCAEGFLGEYADWGVEDAERLARAGVEPIYVLEVEKGQTEYELFYAEDGVLIRAVVDADDNDDRDDLLPSELPAAALEFIAGHFTDPRIIEVERERDVLEVEIIEGRKHREVCFDGKGNWLSTRTELQRQEVPAAVLAALDNSQYAGWRVDDIDHFETPADEWYRFELEEPQSDREVELRIRPDGGIF